MITTDPRGPTRELPPRRLHPLRLRGTARYNVMRLTDSRSPEPVRLSPAALWMLLACLSPGVRARPWVRHLVEQQLAGDAPPAITAVARTSFELDALVTQSAP